MTGKQLKVLVSSLPDEATVLVAGPDNGGYDYTYLDDATIDHNRFNDTYFLKGVGEDGEEL